MHTVRIKDLYENLHLFDNQEVEINGWIRTVRGSKKFGFIELNDGSFLKNVQIVLDRSVIENYDEVVKLPISSTIKIVGIVVSTPDAKQAFEIQAQRVILEGTSNSEYPLQKKKHSYEYLRTIAHLRPRTSTYYSVFRIRSLVSYAIHRFFQERDFVYVHTPLITSSDSEGAGEMFRVTTLDLNNLPKTETGEVDNSEDFFRRQTNLTVSGQLPAEAFALAFGNTYTFGPTFRAENSHTARHASEFWMIEPEMAFADLTDSMDIAEALLHYVIEYVLEKAPEELEFLTQNIDQGLLTRLRETAKTSFARVTYSEAIELLQKSNHTFDYPVTWGIDLQTEHERYICEEIFDRPVFITDYPEKIKAFYMRQNEDKETVAAMDLLVPRIGELIGGSQREERKDVLATRMAEFGLTVDDYEWYLELREYGETVHSGFGIGFERLIMYVTGMENIRDVIPFPRTPGNADF
ncbi:asparagine--tRNA ligase [Melissococcus plutonius]|uniref:Asparagine--tRNA ligase n=1 Tax=Melissococcus plutonius TaxID=33970 RepID=A0A2Z5Y4A8_9ENTE|nr:asparagine--tRNA ligase [Melissococcus plutonius]BAL62721.1 asparaginyl-tRNA synthetase [Melissococcus plutonius DAT561]MCV2498639.1 asparagine--tRNA ligase [Melissococcus plutonius]MCV2500748.1 asparagine--tRNA ligase [Melissococcus plutonius]MCV2504694.1 asparagine--tRNA ligase [Melissococcus plutonius]MCV2507153.1 asparagine--tRNA ligase [Melissococcus plutonius]